MKKSNSKSKAQSAFWNLGAVALITATIFFVACKQTGGGGDKPKPKHAITFSVDSTTPNGTLKAKVDGMAETDKSPINVEEGKTVTFTATPAEGYRVKGWTLDGKPITEAGTNTEYKLKVTKAATVKVSFEEIPKHAITFSVDSTTPNGTLTAKVSEAEINSGKKVEEGKTITFTATAHYGYRVKEWKVDNATIKGNKTNTYTHTVKKPCAIIVSFEKIPKHAITFKVEGGKGYLNAKVDGESINSSNEVEEGKTIIFTAGLYGYRVKEWKVDNATIEGNKTNTYTHTVTAPATITVSFELLPPGEAILTLSPNKRYIEIRAETVDDSDITVEGCTETTLKSTYNTKTTLHANGTTIVLKGYISRIDCSGEYNNRQSLTALNVSGLNALGGAELREKSTHRA